MENNVQVDLMGRGQYQGNFANQLVSNNADVGALKPFVYRGKDGIFRTYINVYKGGDKKDIKNYMVVPLQANTGTLQRDEWKTLDTEVMRTARSVLNGVMDLRTNGLTYNLGNPMGTTVLETRDTKDFGSAQMDMDGIYRGNNDRPVYGYNYLPIPIIHCDFEINARELAASRKNGSNLDTTDAEMASFNVASKLESLLFTDTTYSFGQADDRGRNSIYSYLNHPDRVKFSLGTSWTSLDFDSQTSSGGQVIVDKVSDMIQELVNLHLQGPYTMYIPTGYSKVMNQDYNGYKSITVQERLLKLSGLSAIKVVDTLPADNVVLVQMNRRTVRLVDGIPIQTVQWKEEGNFVTKFKVFTIQVPQVRSDLNGVCGVLHASV